MADNLLKELTFNDNVLGPTTAKVYDEAAMHSSDYISDEGKIKEEYLPEIPKQVTYTFIETSGTLKLNNIIQGE